MRAFFENYINSVSSKFSHEETSELGYRTDFEILLGGIFETIKVRRIDHDAKAKEGNKPDFVVLNHDVPILYIEAKDIGESLDKVEESKQMARYYGYTNLVLTDYVEFRFYRNGIRYEEPIKIATYDLRSRAISPIPEQYEHVAKSLLDFAQSQKEPIRSGKHLAKIMGGKAQRIRDNIRHFFSTESPSTDLVKLYETLKKLLVHDLSPNAFADMYAQTLIYGLFVARYYDKTAGTFSRQEARELIPNSNRLLKHFFDHIVGADFDDRLKFIVDELCEVFSHANVQELMKEYFKQSDLWGNTQEGPDPVIHFYEDFLEEYDPELRKKMGAYYTPLPVVRFIVRSVDHLLKKEFGLSNGLTDTSKLSTGIHKVQILDPAVGTGTFISAVVRLIYEGILKAGQKGRWPTYVHNDLLPRLHGFELMMTPYTIAHLKLGIAFRQTGFWNFHRRLGVYLTNSLEPGISQQQDLFAFGLAESIAEESKEASKIKNETPIMVVIGNPPYSISSSNKSEWILNLIKDYKKNLGERKINLDDDYIKFIRLAEHFIKKNQTGIVAMITNNSFIDGITHRQMRKHLLETFDDIYIMDLHGDAKEDLSKDDNIFDIMQGVAISIFVRKKSKKTDKGAVYFTEIIGKRENKFAALNEAHIAEIQWQKLDYQEPYYFFVPKNFSLIKDYESNFKLTDLFNLYGPGVKTERDSICIKDHIDDLKQIIHDFRNLDENTLKTKYHLYDSRDWKIAKAKRDVVDHSNGDYFRRIQYRPFDYKWTWYSGRSKGFIGTPGSRVGRNFAHQNIGLIVNRQIVNSNWSHVGVTQTLISHGTFYLGNKGQDYLLPLYIYSDDDSKTPNLKEEIVTAMENKIGKVSPEEILDYIYAILHSPDYRERYKDFLKIDFPRIPYPKDVVSFKKLVELGSELRSFHLLESPKVNQFITTYPESGSNLVEKPVYKDGRIYINDLQYFGNVPEVAWNFYIGGYKPAQKWLKDRRGLTLSNEDIEHYQKIIVTMMETEKIMNEINKIPV